MAFTLLIHISMWFLSIILTLGLIFIPDWNDLNLNFATQYLHSLCLNFTPKSQYDFMTQAIVCGNQSHIPQNEVLLLRSSGLIHLIVVSASHLLFIDWFMSKLKFPFIFKLVCLFIYCMVTNLQAPALRGLLALLISHLVLQRKLYWLQSEVILISTLCLFSIQKNFIHSFSTLLSASASLACRPQQSHILKNTTTYLILLPILIAFSAPHPISILINVFLAPLIGFALFPLSITSYFIPITDVTDLLWQALFSVLQQISFEPLTSQWNISLFYLWIYFFTFNCLIILKEKYERACNLHLTTPISTFY